MGFDINVFRARGLRFGGARPTLFQVEMTAPVALGLDAAAQQDFTFKCLAASHPPSQMGQIPVPYFGRKIQVTGDKDYPNWAVNVMNDEDWVVRNLFETWHSQLNAPVANVRDGAIRVENDYKSEVIVTQFSKKNDVLKQYRLVGAWPVIVGPIGLGWNQNNQIETFDVQWAYDYWEPVSR